MSDVSPAPTTGHTPRTEPDGTGHDGQGVTPEYLRGWKAGRDWQREAAAAPLEPPRPPWNSEKLALWIHYTRHGNKDPDYIMANAKERAARIIEGLGVGADSGTAQPLDVEQVRRDAEAALGLLDGTTDVAFDVTRVPVARQHIRAVLRGLGAASDIQSHERPQAESQPYWSSEEAERQFQLRKEEEDRL